MAPTKRSRSGPTSAGEGMGAPNCSWQNAASWPGVWSVDTYPFRYSRSHLVKDSVTCSRSRVDTRGLDTAGASLGLGCHPDGATPELAALCRSPTRRFEAQLR